MNMKITDMEVSADFVNLLQKNGLFMKDSLLQN